jgi:hypothetical protein
MSKIAKRSWVWATIGSLSGLAVSGVIMLLASPVSAAEDCNWYALTSAKQEQENVSRKCGFKGDGWSTDLRAHMAYCQSVPPEEWRKAIEARKQQLQGCGG